MNPFTKHPHQVDETYFTHFKFALKASLTCFAISCILVVHAIFPFLFTTKGGDMLLRLQQKITARQEMTPTGEQWNAM